MIVFSLAVVIFFVDTKFLLNIWGLTLYEIIQIIILKLYAKRSKVLLRNWDIAYSKWPIYILIRLGYAILGLSCTIFLLNKVYVLKSIALILVDLYLILFEIEMIICSVFIGYIGKYTKKYVDNKIEDFYLKFSSFPEYFDYSGVISICKNKIDLNIFLSKLSLDKRKGDYIVKNLKILKHTDIDAYFDLKAAIESKVKESSSIILGLFINILNIFCIPYLKNVWNRIIDDIFKRDTINTVQVFIDGIVLGLIISSIVIFIEVIKEEKEKNKFREVLMYFTESEK